MTPQPNTNPEMLINVDDVYLKPLETRMCEHCEENPATQIVMIALRTVGIDVPVEIRCDKCCREFMERITESFLPKE